MTLGCTLFDVVSVDSGTPNSGTDAFGDFSAGLTLKLEGCINSHDERGRVLLYEFLYGNSRLSDATAWTLRTAVEAARAVGARVAFVDLPIGMTVGSLRKLPLREKVRLGVDSLVSIALLPFGGFNLSKLTENLEEQLRLFRLRYPELSRLLLDVREEFMVARIRDIMYSTAGQVVAVVGYGHLKSLAKALASLQTEPVYSTSVTWNVSTG